MVKDSSSGQKRCEFDSLLKKKKLDNPIHRDRDKKSKKHKRPKMSLVRCDSVKNFRVLSQLEGEDRDLAEKRFLQSAQTQAIDNEEEAWKDLPEELEFQMLASLNLSIRSTRGIENFEPQKAGGLLKKSSKLSGDSRDPRTVKFQEDFTDSEGSSGKIPTFDGPKESSLLCSRVIRSFFDGEFSSEQEFYDSFPEIIDSSSSSEKIATLAEFFAEGVKTLREGRKIMLWDGSGNAVKPCILNRFEEAERIITIIWMNVRIKILGEILMNYDCSKEVYRVSRVPAVLPRVPSY